MKSKLTLRGDRNQCPTCGLLFNSSNAFDKHRTGSHGVDRRCLTVPEMEDKGMVLNKDGFWVGSQRPEESILRHPRGATAADLGGTLATLHAH